MPLNRMRQRELSQDAIWPLQANSPPASHLSPVSIEWSAAGVILSAT
jgi:hypothetical protein